MVPCANKKSLQWGDHVSSTESADGLLEAMRVHVPALPEDLHKPENSHSLLLLCAVFLNNEQEIQPRDPNHRFYKKTSAQWG